MHLKLINAQFDKLFWGRLVSEIGHYLYHFAIGWYILDLTSSAAQTGVYLAFTGIIQVIMTPLGGVLVDRWNRVKVIYMTDFLRSGIILLAGLSITFMPIVDMGEFVLDFSTVSSQLVLLYIIGFLLSILGALFSPAAASVIPDLVDDKALQRANSLTSGLNAFVAIIGSISAGFLYASLGVGAMFIITALGYGISGIWEMTIRTQKRLTKHEKLTPKLALKEFFEGVTYIIQQKGMLAFVVIILFINMIASPLFGVAQPYFYNQVAQVEPYWYSFLGLSVSLGSIIMAALLAKRQSVEKVHVPLIQGIFALSFLIGFNALFAYLLIIQWFTFIAFFIASMSVGFMLGLNLTYVNTPIGVAIHRYVPKEKMGRVNSIIHLLATGLIPISTGITGFLLDSISIPFYFLIVTLSLLTVAILASLSRSLKSF